MTQPTLIAQPLTPERYAPYGEVVMASPRGEEGLPANMGTARRFNRLAALENLRPETARLNVCVFRAEPLRAFPFEVRLLEKHPHSTQLFLPMNAARYLVIVALGGDAPELERLGAFVATGRQGISYRPGVWHHPLIALDQETDFSCLVYEDDTADDCAVVELSEAERRLVHVG